MHRPIPFPCPSVEEEATRIQQERLTAEEENRTLRETVFESHGRARAAEAALKKVQSEAADRDKQLRIMTDQNAELLRLLEQEEAQTARLSIAHEVSFQSAAGGKPFTLCSGTTHLSMSGHPTSPTAHTDFSVCICMCSICGALGRANSLGLLFAISRRSTAVYIESSCSNRSAANGRIPRGGVETLPKKATSRLSSAKHHSKGLCLCRHQHGSKLHQIRLLYAVYVILYGMFTMPCE